VNDHLTMINDRLFEPMLSNEYIAHALLSGDAPSRDE
jgi:hypothetical protein